MRVLLTFVQVLMSTPCKCQPLGYSPAFGHSLRAIPCLRAQPSSLNSLGFTSSVGRQVQPFTSKLVREWLRRVRWQSIHTLASPRASSFATCVSITFVRSLRRVRLASQRVLLHRECQQSAHTLASPRALASPSALAFRVARQLFQEPSSVVGRVLQLNNIINYYDQYGCEEFEMFTHIVFLCHVA